MNKEPNQSQIVIYTTPDGNIKIDAILQNETIWLTQSAMTELFDVNVPAISKHLSNIYEEGELSREATVSKMETVQNEGGRQVIQSFHFRHLTCTNCMRKNTIGNEIPLS